MAKLIYCGPEVVPGAGIPLPEGWPMASHSEDDPEVLAAKLKSGNYKQDVEVATAPVNAAPKEGE